MEERQSLNSFDQFSNQEDLDSYLDPRGLSSFQNYTRRTSEVSWMSRKYFTSNESNDIFNCYDGDGVVYSKLVDLEDEENKRSLSMKTIPLKSTVSEFPLTNIKDEKSFCVPERNTIDEDNNQNYQKTQSKDMKLVNEPIISRNKYRTAILDVGGVHYRSKITNFSKHPASRLGKIFRARTTQDLLRYCDGFTPSNPPVVYFDRSDENFTSILDLYRMEELHLCKENCAQAIHEDLKFWGLEEINFEPCCAIKFYPQIADGQIEIEEEKVEQEKERKRIRDEDFGLSFVARLRTKIWNILEYPETSKTAQAMGLTSLFMVCLSTITFMIETTFEGEVGETYSQDSVSILQSITENIEYFTVLFFTLEFILRLIICPRKWKFLTNQMNIIDLLAIFPFFLSALLTGLEDMQIIGKTGNIMRLIRIMRILRVFKMVRHFSSLQSLIYTLRKAYKELGLLCLIVSVSILLFASLIFAVEADGPEKATWSFTESFWWGLMTFTTVGYDMTPATFWGKLVFGMCATAGIFIIYLPIPIVVTGFASCYRNKLWRNEIFLKKRIINQKKKEERMLEDKKKLFINFAKVGIYITQTQQLLEESESLLGNEQKDTPEFGAE